MSSIIQVTNLSKSYTISHEGKEKYTAMRDVIAKKAKNIFSFSPSPPSSKEEFWALKDVSFNIEPGDRIGIIGRNGAGKSTLLKILSRITEPTNGEVKMKGRVASLLEVGTGFHPELSGRENIFLNGAILGMSRVEVKKQFDAIVDFAEIEQFLDTPVKRYSSGMYVRLAFAVAAHMEPEILIVDEVLAVGDAQFQKKCLGKMEDVSRNEGRTILMVSHNMNVLKSLCSKGILLSEGRVVENTDINTLVSHYLSGSTTDHSLKYYHKEGGKLVRIEKVKLADKTNSSIRVGEALELTIEYKSNGLVSKAEFFVLIYNDQGECVQGIFQQDEDQLTILSTNGSLQVTIDNDLIPGKYLLSVGCFDSSRNFLDWVEHCERFEIDVLYTDDRVFKPRLGLLRSNNAKWETTK